MITSKYITCNYLYTSGMASIRGLVVCLAFLLTAVLNGAEKPANHPELPEPAALKLSKLTGRVASHIAAQPSQPALPHNFIDERVFARQKQAGVPRAGLCSDSEFLRRVSLDLTGRLPEPGAVRAFLADHDPQKRDTLINKLMETSIQGKIEKPETPFLDKWTYFFGDVFRNSYAELGRGRNLFREYLYDSLLLNQPYDEMVREMLTVTSRDNWVDGASNFLIRDHVDDFNDVLINNTDSYDEMAISTGKCFLGVNLECVSCHGGAAHLDKINLWLKGVKRQQFWKQAAFFSKLNIGRPYGIGQEMDMSEKGGGYDITKPSVRRMPRFKSDLSPEFVLSGEKPKEGENWRAAYARMLTENPQFARATVNMVWAELVGVGIVDPPFEFDLSRQDPAHPPPAPWTIQPSDPELLDALATDFRNNHYDLRRLIRTIVASSTYQLSSAFPGTWKDSYAPYFARHLVRRLDAEEIADAISQATGVAPSIPILETPLKVSYVMQTRSSEDIGGKELEPLKMFLSGFGQADRDKNLKERVASTVQAAALLNSKFVKESIKVQDKSRAYTLLHHDPPLSNGEVVDELFLAYLSRLPAPAEKILAVNQLAEHHDQGIEDLAWNLINKTEFVYNY